MKNCVIRIVLFVIVAITLLSVLSSSYATVTGTFKGSVSLAADAEKASVDIIKAVLDVIRYVGSAIALGILLVIGIKYLVASAGERADIKKYAVNYIIGAIILFASSNIFTIIKNFATKSTGG